MPLGPNDLKQIVLPVNVDPTTLHNYALRDGTTFAAIVADINGALGMLNGSLRGGYLAGLFSETSDLVVDYAMGSVNGVEIHTEYAQPDARRGAIRSHMLPFTKYDRKLAWTWDYLKEARRSQLDADIAAAIQDWRDNWERRMLLAFFTMEATAIGAVGFSLPFANGGVSDTAWIPPPYGGNTFLSTHDHYFRTTDDGAGRLASLATMAETLAHHGHMPPFDLIIPSADVAAWTAVTGFIGAARPEIAFASTVSLANLDQAYLGVFNTDYGVIRIYVSTRLATDTAGMYKRYGNLDQRNPLRVRVDPVYYSGNVVLQAFQNVQEFPLEAAITFQAIGVGTGDRTNGAFTTFAASGDYVSPLVA